MKKIVMGIAAVAMAASMFAADVSGRVKMDTKVFNTAAKEYDKDAIKDASAHKVFSRPASMGWDEDNTFLKFAASTENSGAELWLQNAEAKFTQYSIWFKPVDALKVTIGDIFVQDGVRGTFAWWDYSVWYKHQNAILVNANVGPVALEVACADLIDWDKKGYGMVGDFWVGATFGLGDAGSLKAVVSKGATTRCYGFGDPSWKKGGRQLVAGLAYDFMPWQTTGVCADVFAAFDAGVDKALAFDNVFGQVNGQLILDAVNLRLVNVYSFNSAKKFKYGFLARAELKTIDNVTPFAELRGQDIMSKKLDARLGCETAVGGCSITTYIDVDMTFGGTTKVLLPVEFTFNL